MVCGVTIARYIASRDFFSAMEHTRSRFSLSAYRLGADEYRVTDSVTFCLFFCNIDRKHQLQQ